MQNQDVAELGEEVESPDRTGEQIDNQAGERRQKRRKKAKSSRRKLSLGVSKFERSLSAEYSTPKKKGKGKRRKKAKVIEMIDLSGEEEPSPGEEPISPDLVIDTFTRRKKKTKSRVGDTSDENGDAMEQQEQEETVGENNAGKQNGCARRTSKRRLVEIEEHQQSGQEADEGVGPEGIEEDLEIEFGQNAAGSGEQSEELDIMPAANDAALMHTSPLMSPDTNAPCVRPVKQIKCHRNVNTDACRWLTRSLGHPLSKEALVMKIRPSLQKAIDFVESNLESTIKEDFNNSILMFGAPGSGKSLAISRICSKANQRWNSDPEDPRVVIVRLSGWAHSDERVAFREIARQLCSALKLEYFRTASFGENIQFLLAILKGMADVDKTALFLLEDFDMFARVQRQTFLYCLLDSLQKSDAKAVVVGTTCRYDCMDMLEKRVKSRFSHRSIVLCPPMCLGATKTEAKKRAQAKNLIQIKDEDGAIAILESMLTLPEEYPDLEFSKAFNKATTSATRDPKVLDSVNKLLDNTNNLHEIANVARWALSDAEMQDGNHIGIHANSIVNAISVADEQYKGFDSLISGLSILELTFLVAAHRVLRKQPSDAILNFESILHEFRTYVASGDHVDNYSKTAANKAFDSLQSMGLIAPSRTPCGSLSRRNKNFMPVNLQASRAEIVQGVKDHSTCPMRLAEWCIKESGPGTTARTFLT